MTVHHCVCDEVLCTFCVSLLTLHDIFPLQLDPRYLVEESSEENTAASNETDGTFV